MPHFPDFNSSCLCQLLLVGLNFFFFCGVCGCKWIKRNYNGAFVALQLLSQTRLKCVCIARIHKFCAGNCRFSSLFSPCSGRRGIHCPRVAVTKILRNLGARLRLFTEILHSQPGSVAAPRAGCFCNSYSGSCQTPWKRWACSSMTMMQFKLFD